MNIEEERKAFELALPGGTLPTNVAWDGERYAFPSGGKTLTQDYFEMWLAAKAHAEEIAKPACNVWQTMSDEWRVVHAGESRNVDQLHTHWPTRAEALQWAKDNGYRVVSE